MLEADTATHCVIRIDLSMMGNDDGEVVDVNAAETNACAVSEEVMGS